MDPPAPQPSPEEIAQAEQLKLTVLAPFFQRIGEDYNAIIRLQDENQVLKASLAEFQHTSKRKSSTSSSSEGDEPHNDTYQPLENLVKDVYKALEGATPNETIHLCGLAPLWILSTRPLEVLQLANEKLNTWKYDQVATCWRRLYEEASLHIVADLLKELSTQTLPAMNRSKRARLDQDDSDFKTHIGKIAERLDGAIIIAGAPGRKALIEETFRQLETIMRFVLPHAPVQKLVVQRSQGLGVQDADLHNHIKHANQAWSIDAFQTHLEQDGTPVIIPNSFKHWPASRLWQDLSYLKRRTLAGYRTVPVEIGTSYIEDDWTQRMMTFNEFTEQFLVPEEPTEIGYLAQHDLFKQIPELRADITIPDYCYTNPPAAQGAAAETSGLEGVSQLDEPLLNAWLGPKGTKTPLHTDPYHNILCQVAGYKYVRLYPPEETEKVYPEGTTEAGIDMSNTSQVDIWPFVPRRDNQPADPEKLEELREEFPLFETAKYQEAVLGPGECLYIPLGYWHYVESLSSSFSVSFWWN